MAVPVPVIVPTLEYVAIGFPNCIQGSWYTKLSYKILHKGYHQYDDVVNEFRQKVLGIVKHPKSATSLQMVDGKLVPVLHAHSKYVLPHPFDWPETAHSTGYWFLDQHDGWQPSPDLVDFLEGGEKPVYVGFGSIVG
jgi:sterol 3beta-glucosyltransferase